MPLYIIERDITAIECDAIVNAANKSLLGGGGVDGAIHAAAGIELLRECRTLGGCEVGEAKITKGYNLPAKYVIHTVGPIWHGGERGERELLTSCYEKSLEIAKEYGCESVAFPLISSGIYGYPKNEALKIAVEAIKKFLLLNEMTVYITFLDRSVLKMDKKLLDDVKEYVDENYEGEPEISPREASLASRNLCRRIDYVCYSEDAPKTPSLEDMLSNLDDTFAVTLMKLIDEKGMSDVECYKKANVSKQTWYKILNEKNYRPSKNTVIAFAIALELTLDETKSLLATVGFALSRSCKFDVVIEYFLVNGEYDIDVINQTLFKLDQVCLGV